MNTPGSLAFEIDAVNQDKSNDVDTIQFQLSPGQAVGGIWTITPSGALSLTHPATLDGTSQAGYAGTPVIEISGQGLTLAAKSDGSTIRGLDIVNAAGAGITVASNSDTVQSNYVGILPDGKTAAGNGQGIVVSGTGNTIGGPANGAGNLVADNNGAGIDVTAPNSSANSVRGNLIYGNTGAAFSTQSSLSAPQLSSATSNGGTTTIHGSFAVVPAIGTIVDLYASNGSLTPAAIYLGSTTLTAASFNGSNFTASVTGASVPTGASVVATATSPAPGSDTSGLSNSQPVTNPFAVTTAADNGDNANPTPGSLRAAINNVINDTGNPNADTITFAIGTGPVTITLTSRRAESAEPSRDPRRDHPAGLHGDPAGHHHRRHRPERTGPDPGLGLGRQHDPRPGHHRLQEHRDRGRQQERPGPVQHDRGRHQRSDGHPDQGHERHGRRRLGHRRQHDHLRQRHHRG